MKVRTGISRTGALAAGAGILLLLLLTIWGFYSWSTKRSFEKLKARLLDATVYIETTDAEGRTAFGSGFFVSSLGDILTNLHVVENAASIRVRVASGDVHAADIFFFDKQNDVANLRLGARELSEEEKAERAEKRAARLAVLERRRDAAGRTYGTLDELLGSEDAEPFVARASLRLRSTQARKGEAILAVGAPWGFRQTISAGKVSAVADDPERGTHLQITAPIAKGSSGGPVVDEKGNVVGMSTLIYQTESGRYNYAVASTVLREFVANESGLKPQQERELKALEEKYPDVDMQARYDRQQAEIWERNPLLADRLGVDAPPHDPVDPVWKLMELQNRERREADRNRERDPFPSARQEELDAQEEKINGYDDFTISEDQEGYIRELTALYAMQNERRAPLAENLPLPTAEGFFDTPWGSSVPTVKERIPWLTYGSRQNPDRRVLEYNVPGLYEIFEGGGKFTASLSFFDNRLGRVTFIQLPEGGVDPTDRVVRELTSRYGASPRKTNDRRGNFTTYVWERNGMRTTVNAPRSDAERPTGGGTMSFYAFTVQFDQPGITGPWERR